MKATELMIGDWVRIAPYDIIDQVDCFLTEYAVTSHGDTCCQYEYKDIEPILLTPEILKKNGFELVADIDMATKAFIDLYDVWGCKTMFKSFTLFYNRYSQDYRLHAFRDNISNIYFVHELQHAMRFCGVEKEIEL